MPILETASCCKEALFACRPSKELERASWATFLDGLISRGSPDERWPPFAPAHPWRMVLGNFGKPLAPWLSLTNASYSANCAFWDQLSWSDDLL